MVLKGRVWKFGDNLTSNHFLSGKHDPLVRAGKYDELARHVLEDTAPAFVERVRAGDLIVAGRAFGRGKHLEGLIGAFRSLGLGGVIAEGFSAAWERETINLGFPGVVCAGVHAGVETGDLLEIDLRAHEAINHTRGTTIRVTPTPDGILAILEAGGLEPYTLQRLREAGAIGGG